MSERGNDGRFQHGNRASVGNKGGRPRRATEERYLSALIRAVPLEHFQGIIDAQAALAREGKGPDSVAAFRALASYLIGKPTEYVNVDASIDGTSTITLTFTDGTNADPDPEPASGAA